MSTKIIAYRTVIMFCACGILFVHCVKRVPVASRNPGTGELRTGHAGNTRHAQRDESYTSGDTSVLKDEFLKMAYNDSIHLLLATKSYSDIIYPGDQLEVAVYEKLPVSQEKRIEMKRVSGNGDIVIVPVGEIPVAGLTVLSAQQVIEERLRAYVRSPFCEIAIAHRTYEPVVYVFGEVHKNGTLPLKRQDRLLDILSASGGCKDDAYKRSIKIIRTRHDGRVTVFSINLNDIMEYGKMEENILLQDRDIVFVPRRLLTNYSEVLSTLGGLIPWYVFLRNVR